MFRTFFVFTIGGRRDLENSDISSNLVKVKSDCSDSPNLFSIFTYSVIESRCMFIYMFLCLCICPLSVYLFFEASHWP